MLCCAWEVQYRFLIIDTSPPHHNHERSRSDEVNYHSSTDSLSDKSYSTTSDYEDQ